MWKIRLKKEFGQTKSYLMIISDDQDRIRSQASAQLGGTICSVISSVEPLNRFFHKQKHDVIKGVTNPPSIIGNSRSRLKLCFFMKSQNMSSFRIEMFISISEF